MEWMTSAYLYKILKFVSSDDDRMNRRWIHILEYSTKKNSSANIVAHGIHTCQIQKLQIPFFSALLFLCRLYSIFACMTKIKKYFFDNNVKSSSVSGFKEEFFDSLKFENEMRLSIKKVQKSERVIQNQIASTQTRITCILCSLNNQFRVKQGDQEINIEV